MSRNLTKPFVLILVGVILVGCYFVFKPFLMEIMIAAILTMIFYAPFERFAAFLKGRRYLAATLMCLLLLAVIILPTIKLVIYAGEKSVDAYSQAVEFFESHSTNGVFDKESISPAITRIIGQNSLAKYLNQNESFQGVMLNIFKESSNWLISGATIFVKETTNFVVSMIMIILAMLFFFVDGKKMLERLMRLSPLPDKYDQEIFKKFKSVSYTTFISTFVTAAAQGVVGAIGFAFVGFPAFLAGVVVALLSLLPYLGSMIFYIPVGLYYLATGKIWQGVFVLLWGFLIIGTVDNVIRTYMVKDKAEVNPIFVLFSILGGITLFGFWGVILGPLIVALAVTIFHIYEMEFSDSVRPHA